jgi:hypothetical protein
MYLQIIPRHIANPKRIQYCVKCRKIYDWSHRKCYQCTGKLDTLQYISYLFSLHKENTVSVCPSCNSYDIDISDLQIIPYVWESGYCCNNCSRSFKEPIYVNKKEWFNQNFPEFSE